MAQFRIHSSYLCKREKTTMAWERHIIHTQSGIVKKNCLIQFKFLARNCWLKVWRCVNTRLFSDATNRRYLGHKREVTSLKAWEVLVLKLAMFHRKEVKGVFSARSVFSLMVSNGFLQHSTELRIWVVRGAKLTGLFKESHEMIN
jgi:hypothetical protein